MVKGGRETERQQRDQERQRERKTERGVRATKRQEDWSRETERQKMG